MKCFSVGRLTFLLVVFCLVLLLIPWANAEKKEGKNICFRWAFGAMVGPENDRRLVAITRDTTLRTGDQLKLLVELKKKCFVYLIYHSGQDDILMLFPYKLEQFFTDYEISKKYFIPQGNLWFELDENFGVETFYLLASATRLNELEALFENHKTEEAIDKQKRVKKILKQIRKIKKQYRKLVTEYHPDKIEAKGLPEEFIKFANDKFKEIQEAYDNIKKERGI
ncbi:MAG: DUF4384 domain-containing protein [Desulfobacula sp.]|nr:DUF4384 domain-containing protein [Desulfobacula sp.]